MANTIRIEGLDDLMAGLEREWSQAVTRGAEAVAQTAKKIEATARELAPVGPTGDLRSSIHTSGTGTFREVGPSARYGRFVEFGTFKDAPQPFMWPAADRHEGDLVRDLERLVGEL